MHKFTVFVIISPISHWGDGTVMHAMSAQAVDDL